MFVLAYKLERLVMLKAVEGSRCRGSGSVSCTRYAGWPRSCWVTRRWPYVWISIDPSEWNREWWSAAVFWSASC